MLHKRLPFAAVTAALAVAAVVLCARPGHTASGPDVSHFTLANGLEVVVIPDRRTPVVTHMIWYKVGAADEPPGKSGIAHFLEHLMFKGTAKHPIGQFSQKVAEVGGQENAFTSSDYTGYFQRVTREHLETMMEFEADRMTGLILTDEVVRPELQVVLEEWNQRIGNVPSARWSEQIEAALYLNHPYGRPVIGWRPEIEKLNREEALAFYRRFYTPNNAIVVVAGDVTAEEVRALAEKTYGRIAKRAEIGPRIRPQEPNTLAIRQVTVSDPRVEQPSMQRAYLVPSYATAAPGEAEALEVLAQILGGGSTSRLYRALVADNDLATSAGSWFQGTALDPSRFTVYASPRPGTTLPQLEAAVDSELQKLLDKGIDEAELKRAKTGLIAHVIHDQDSQSKLARSYGAALTTGLSVEMVRTWPDRIRNVSADAVMTAARRYLDKRRSVTGYLIKETARHADKRP